jgi:ABC-2 type transport system permease protein
MLMIGALIFVYLYNFSVLSLDKLPIAAEHLKNIIAFLNIGLAGFVVSALSVRFIYPYISLEGRAYAMIRSAPISTHHFVISKFINALIPMIIVSQILVIASNIVLGTSGLITGLSVCTMGVTAVGIVSIGIATGAFYPDFASLDSGRISSGYGGLICMLLSVSLVAITVLLETYPAYVMLLKNWGKISIDYGQYIEILFLLFIALISNLAVIIWPIRLGIKKLAHLDIMV